MRKSLVILALLVTGCQTGRPCPKGLGEPGDLCTVIIIPTPADAFTDTMQAISMLRNVLKEGREDVKEN